MPIPSDEEAAKRRAEWTHRGNETGQAWNLQAPAIWPGLARDYEAAIVHSTVQRLRIPMESSYEHEARALVSLARLGMANGRGRDLNSLHEALFGVPDAAGDLLEGGIARDDAMHVAWDWNAKKGHLRVGDWLPRDRLTSTMDLMIGHLVYETAVRDGLVWLAALSRAAQGKPSAYSKSMGAVTKSGQLRLPHFQHAVDAFRSELGNMGRRQLLSKQERQALRRWMDALQKPGLTDQPKQQVLRDAVAHGRLWVSHDGTVVLDAYEHLMVNRHGLRTKGRRWDRVHNYKFRTVKAENCEKFLEHACGQAALVWAAAEEFRRAYHATEPAERASERPTREAIQGLRKGLAPLRTTAREKLAAAERLHKKRRRALKNFKVTFHGPADPGHDKAE